MKPSSLANVRAHAQRRRAGLAKRRAVAQKADARAPAAEPRSSAGEVAALRRFFNRERFAGGVQPLADELSDQEIKGKWRALYNSINDHINTTIFRDDAIFLNYGYVANDSPRWSQVELPPHYPNANCVELILELVGDEPLAQRDVLDIGCGRGGNAVTMTRFFKPRTVSGVDMSFEAVRFCRRSWRGLRFTVGDAERLPFPDASFDVVTNVESSCCYPDWPSFARGVHRVLRPSGSFLYTDLFPNDSLSEMLEYLDRLGFELERDTDISRNVLLSCDEAARRVAQVYKDYLDETVQAHFVGVPGTTPYDEMMDGSMSYRIFRLRKTDKTNGSQR